MKPPAFLHAALSVASALLIGYLASPPVFAQQSPKEFNSPAKEPIKEEPTIWLSEGVPDIQSIWSNKWIVDMADGRFAEKTVEVPFTDWGRKLWEERTSTLQAYDPNLQCKPSGLPRAAGTPYPLQIIQLPKEVVFLYQRWSAYVPQSSGRWAHAQQGRLDVDGRFGWAL